MTENQTQTTYPSPTTPNLTFDNQFLTKSSPEASKTLFPPLTTTSVLTSPIEPTISKFNQSTKYSSAYENAYISAVFNSGEDYTDDLLSLCMTDFDLSPISPPAPPPSPETVKQNQVDMMDFYMNHDDILYPIQQQEPIVKVEEPEKQYSLAAAHLFEGEDEEDIEEVEIDQSVGDLPTIEPAQLFNDTSSESSNHEYPSSIQQQSSTPIDLFSDSEDDDEQEIIPIPEPKNESIPEKFDDLSEYEPDQESEDEPYSPRPTPTTTTTRKRKISSSPSPSQVKYFICPNTDCAKVFNRNYNLNTHLKTHESDRSRPYHCHYCEASFIRFNDLTRHSVSHSKKKAFWCDGCGGGFTRRDALKRHMKMLGCGDLSLVTKKARKE